VLQIECDKKYTVACLDPGGVGKETSNDGLRETERSRIVVSLSCQGAVVGSTQVGGGFKKSVSGDVLGRVGKTVSR